MPKAKKPASAGAKVIMMRDVSDTVNIAVARAKRYFGVGHNVRAAELMIERYWSVSDQLAQTEQELQEYRNLVDRLASARRSQAHAAGEIDEIFENLQNRR